MFIQVKFTNDFGYALIPLFIGYPRIILVVKWLFSFGIGGNFQPEYTDGPGHLTNIKLVYFYIFENGKEKIGDDYQNLKWD